MLIIKLKIAKIKFNIPYSEFVLVNLKLNNSYNSKSVKCIKNIESGTFQLINT